MRLGVRERRRREREQRQGEHDGEAGATGAQEAGRVGGESWHHGAVIVAFASAGKRRRRRVDDRCIAGGPAVRGDERRANANSCSVRSAL